MILGKEKNGAKLGNGDMLRFLFFAPGKNEESGGGRRNKQKNITAIIILCKRTVKRKGSV